MILFLNVAIRTDSMGSVHSSTFFPSHNALMSSKMCCSRLSGKLLNSDARLKASSLLQVNVKFVVLFGRFAFVLCALNVVQGVYTRVSAVHDWVNKTVCAISNHGCLKIGSQEAPTFQVAQNNLSPTKGATIQPSTIPPAQNVPPPQDAGGNMIAGSAIIFDIQASNNVNITSLALRVRCRTADVSVYGKNGTGVGHSQDESAWEFLGTVHINNVKPGSLVFLPEGSLSSVSIEQNMTRSFLVETTRRDRNNNSTFEANCLVYISGDKPGLLYSNNEDLRIDEGLGYTWSTSRIFTGGFSYKKGGSLMSFFPTQKKLDLVIHH